MKRCISVSACLLALVLGAQRAAQAQDADEEAHLISVLQGSTSLQDKDTACARLKWIGTVKSIPALENLLTDDQLSHSARYALESMKEPEAETALLQALPKTSGSNEVGIINSLGARGDAAAVPELAKLLASGDTGVALAAADALGHIGGANALAALQSAWSGTSADVAHNAQVDALLACGNQLLTIGRPLEALPVFQELYGREKDDGIRLAAYRGVILSSEKKGLALMVEAIGGPDGPSQGAALTLASKLGGPATTDALASLLSKTAAPIQIALLQALDLRGDRRAAPAVAGLLDNRDRDVRLAAITALGDLGDGKAALGLAGIAASATGAEKAAARQALTDLRHGPVTTRILESMKDAKPEEQAELIRALGERGDVSAASKVFGLARDENDAVRSAALEAVARLAGPDHLPDLIELVIKAPNQDRRSEAADALNAACQHIELRNGHLDAAALVQATQSAPIEARLVLLGVCSGVPDSRVREVLREEALSSDPRLRETATRALCETVDPDLLPDLLKLACAEGQDKSRLLAIQGCVRLTTQVDGVKMPVPAKLNTFKAILDTSLSTPEKRLILSGLGAIHDHRALALVTPMLDDSDVQAEAAEAVINIAGSIPKKRAGEAREAGAALKKVLAMSSIDPATQKSAEKAYRKFQ